jgi:L-ascorbate metabolism protein UlaG (beta-lactamase superfamily)
VATRLLLVPVLLALASCASVNPYYDARKPHHRPDGFNNLHLDNFRADQPSFWRWQWERLGQTLPADEPERVPRTRPDAAALRQPTRDATVTWLGHSTALWQVNGLNLITDPHLGPRASPVGFAGPKRLTPVPLPLAELPRIDVVLISHNHYDHLDRDTVLALNRQPGGPPLFVVPLGVDLWMQAEGITRVQRMDWWDTLPLPAPGGALQLHFVPVQHWSSRTPFDRNATLWGGFVLQAQVNRQPLSLFYAGDTGYSADFATLGHKFGGFDFAQIPVGCYEPRWFMRNQHINEEEAVRIHLDVKSRLSMGVHWGTFRLCDEPIQAPLEGLPRARERLGVKPEDFVLFSLGETRVLRRTQP